VCVVSGGNINPDKLAEILGGADGPGRVQRARYLGR